MIKVIGVRFRRAGKVYYFNPLDMDITTGMHVIVETARGVEYGYVVLGVKDMDEEKVFQPLKPVIRIATPQDDAVADENRQKEKAAGPFWVRRLFPSLVICPGMLYIVNTMPETASQGRI